MADVQPGAPSHEGAFHDLDSYLAIPRVAGLVLSPDGSRLVCPVQMLSSDRTSYITALWDVDPRGSRPARRLTHSAKGESSPAFMANGDLLFVSQRPDTEAGAVHTTKPDDENGPDHKKPDDALLDDGRSDDVARVWILPTAGGEAQLFAAAAGDISAIYVAHDS
ncbi:MAG: hypothetical protein ACRDV3_17925, partial [Acidothermaceae bacterium]